MSSKIKPPVLVPPQPAIVNVTLAAGGFVDIVNTSNDPGDPRLCTATVVLQTPAPNGITQDASGTLIVKLDMDIAFVMTDSDHKLAGIGFRRVRGSGPGNGSNNMPKDKIKITEDAATNTTTLLIKDKHANSGPKNTWVWDILLMIQDSSGAIGIIDPDLENQD